MNNENYQADIGIETHVQLKTKSKLFCGCANISASKEPNRNLCPICLGLPGTLPVLNRRAVELAIKAGLAMDAEINQNTKFDRKNYFYPDLPKGYQISQYDQPVVREGIITVSGEDGQFKVEIERAHLEEDAGKLVHPQVGDYSLVDLNRAGTPLLEVVSRPDMHSPAQAKAYARELYLIMKKADVSDVDLSQGNMRFDVNVSVRPKGSKALGTRSETKNLNSFKSVERAVEFEINRQIELLEKGEKVVQETRNFDEATGKTSVLRSKEEAEDYRYFPEPDIPPVVIKQKEIGEIAESLPLLPAEIREKLSDTINPATIETLISRDGESGRDYSQKVLDAKETSNDLAEFVANYIVNDFFALLEGADTDQLASLPDIDQFQAVYQLREDGSISSNGAAELLAKLGVGEDAKSKAEELNLIQVSDTDELETMVEEAINENESAAQDVREGAREAIGFLVGQVMQKSQGQANPQKVQEILREKLIE